MMEQPVVSASNCPLAYVWGDDCKGYTLVDRPDFVVKQELMPAGTAEQWHVHDRAAQFFYILNGTATFSLEQTEIKLEARQGLLVEAGKRHRIRNCAAADLEFILYSSPSTAADRRECAPAV